MAEEAALGAVDCRTTPSHKGAGLQHTRIVVGSDHFFGDALQQFGGHYLVVDAGHVDAVEAEELIATGMAVQLLANVDEHQPGAFHRLAQLRQG